MPRSVNSRASRERRRRLLKLAKGFHGRGKNVLTVSKNKIEKGKMYSYRDRRQKKRMFRRLWIQRINAAVRILGKSYSDFIKIVREKEKTVNRKELSNSIMTNFEGFKNRFFTV